MLVFEKTYVLTSSIRRDAELLGFCRANASLISRRGMIEMRSVRGRSFVISLLVAAFILTSCSFNPEVRKRKLLDRGVAYFEKGQYREANIEFENAIQIDPKFADAHYRLAQSFMKQGDWSHAYQELTRTVEFDPTNWKAQLDLGNVLLAGRQYQQAQ